VLAHGLYLLLYRFFFCCFFVHVKAAFFFAGIFPPPAASAEIFAGTDGTGAGCAADAYKAFIVQGIVRDLVFADMLSYLFGCPVQ
jgi:hypothetical protein